MFKGTLSKSGSYSIDVTAAPTNGATTIVTIQWPGAKKASDIMLVAAGGTDSRQGKVPKGAKLLLVDVDGPSNTSKCTLSITQGKAATNGTVRGDDKWTFAIL
jgi:hypothetical protein